MVKMYYDKDADLSIVRKNKVGIIGYGIQGRGQALNLRDSGVDIRIGNIQDLYFKKAKEDSFPVSSPEEVAKWADIIMFLIPDDAQEAVYKKSILPGLQKGNTIVFAHGYSIYYKRISISQDIDVVLLAPRMPGKYVRERFLEGWGAPAFVSVEQDATGQALDKVLSLAKAIGATRVGVIESTFTEETEIDLFIEQFVLPTITGTLHNAFDFLVSKGFQPEVVISELYASGEIGSLLLKAADSNIYQVFRNHASPTCQFGKMKNMDKVVHPKLKEVMSNVLNEIRSAEFDKQLKAAGKDGYKDLKEYDDLMDKTQFVKTHNLYNKLHLSQKK